MISMCVQLKIVHFVPFHDKNQLPYDAVQNVFSFEKFSILIHECRILLPCIHTTHTYILINHDFNIPDENNWNGKIKRIVEITNLISDDAFFQNEWNERTWDLT